MPATGYSVQFEREGSNGNESKGKLIRSFEGLVAVAGLLIGEPECMDILYPFLM